MFVRKLMGWYAAIDRIAPRVRGISGIRTTSIHMSESLKLDHVDAGVSNVSPGHDFVIKIAKGSSA
jgi:hypothetical protein